jgi:hypothetical protein
MYEHAKLPMNTEIMTNNKSRHSLTYWSTRWAVPDQQLTRDRTISAEAGTIK